MILSSIKSTNLEAVINIRILFLKESKHHKHLKIATNTLKEKAKCTGYPKKSVIGNAGLAKTCSV